MSTKQRTELSEFVRQVRGDLSQQAFEKELESVYLQKTGSAAKMPSKGINLLETGTTKSLSDVLLTALSLHSGRPKEELEAMHRRELLGITAKPTRTINILVGHTAWGANLVAAALSAELEGLRLATCARREVWDDKTWRPSVESARWIEFIRGKSDPLYDEVFLKSIREPNTYFFSAKDAMRALGRFAHVIAVPSAIAGESTVHLARLVSAETSGLLVCDRELGEKIIEAKNLVQKDVEECWKSSSACDAVLSAEELREILGSEYRIGGEEGTIGALLAKQALSNRDNYAPIDLQRIKHPQKRSRLGGSGKAPAANSDAQNARLQSLDDLCIDLGNAKPLHCAVVWQPQATWIMQALREAGQPQHLLIPLLQECDHAYKRRPHFKFDLVTTREYAQDPVVIQMVERLLLHTARVSKELELYDIDRYSEEAPALAEYFQLGEGDNPASPRKIMQVIGSVGFDVQIDPETAFKFFSKGSR